MNFLTPYFLYIKIAAAALILSVVFFGGCRVQKASDAEEISELKSELSEADSQLRVADKALRDQNAANEAYIAKQAKLHANETTAREEAERAKRFAESRAQAFKAQYEHARKNPDCLLLLNMDLKKVCGI